MRAGDSMVDPLVGMIPNISIGKILIQRDEATAQPIYFYSKLPSDVTEMKKVFLLDPMLATGGSASVAIQTIIDKGVEAKKITFINLVACPDGIQRIQNDHPEVNIITANIDPILNGSKYIIPGLGDYGDRYFASTRHWK